MEQVSLDLYSLVVATDACVTVAEALEANDPDREKYLRTAKLLSDLTNHFLAGVSEQENQGETNELDK